jgi:hypothetical protein
LSNVESRFTQIYNSNYWGNKDSYSGFGSTLKYTENLRLHLPSLFQKYGIVKILDAPCGDFHWMKAFLNDNPQYQYIGGDIVAPLIENLNLKYSAEGFQFQHLDLTSSKLEKFDALFCRDCLFHLSYSNIEDVINNFLKSESSYLITTSHINNGRFKNHDINTGDFRLIDLFSDPFNFPEALDSIEDWMKPENPRAMFIWSRDQLINHPITFSS